MVSGARDPSLGVTEVRGRMTWSLEIEHLVEAGFRVMEGQWLR